MSPATPKDIAVIIPARNEEQRIGTCLGALARQEPSRVTIIVVVNNTSDGTGPRARKISDCHGMDLILLEPTLAPGQGAGTARRIGCNHALRSMPGLRYIMTTDADCIVAPDWIARNLAHLQKSDAVCGKVNLIPHEAGILDGMDREFATLEGIYRDLVQDIYARHAPDCADICGTHGEAAGASLAFSKVAYLAVEGFASIQCGEDRTIVRALRQAGRSVCHASDVTVQASCRLTGRAVGGMSDALKARISGKDYLIDDCLPAADWLVKRTADKALGPWPPQVPPRFRINVRDLPEHISILENFRISEWTTDVSISTSSAAPSTRVGPLQPCRGSAIAPAGPVPQACPSTRPRMSATPQTKVSALPTAKGA